MFLNVLERLLLLQLLPESGNLTTITIVRQLRESLSFNEDEHEVLQFRTLPNNNMQWRTPNDWETFAQREIGKCPACVTFVLMEGVEDKCGECGTPLVGEGTQWAMWDASFIFNGEWSQEKNAQYATRCQELVLDGVEIKLGKKARQEVKEWLKKLDEEDQVREAHYTIFEKLGLLDDLLDDD